MLKKGYDIPYIHPLRIRNHVLQPTPANLLGLEHHIRDVIHLLPQNIDYMYAFYDEDFSLPPDDGNEDEPYNTIQNALRRNECLRTKYNNNQTEIRPGSIAFYQGMFIAPVGIIPFPKLLPALSPGKRHCFKDILFPVPWSLPSYTRKIE